MGKKLIIFEFENEVNHILKNHPGLFNEDVLVLSLMPGASALLKKNNIPFVASCDFFDKTSHEHCLTAVDDICKKINDTVLIKDSNGLSNVYLNTFTFHLRFYLSYLVFVIEIVQKIKEQYKIDHIYAFQYNKNNYLLPQISHDERILSDIVELLQVPTTTFTLKNNLKTTLPFFKFFRPVMYGFFNFFERMSIKKSPSVLFYSFGNNLKKIAEAIKGAKIVTVLLQGKDVLKRKSSSGALEYYNLHVDENYPAGDREFKKSIAKLLETLKAEKHLFSYKSAVFFDLVARKIKKCFVKKLFIFNSYCTNLKKDLAAVRPKMVISAMSREYSYGLGEVCKVLEIPSLLISHGSHVPPNNEYDAREWYEHSKGLINTDYTYHALQTPWAKKHVDSFGFKKEYINIKPIAFSSVARENKLEKQLKMYPESKGKKVIVHAGTPKTRAFMRLYIYETTDEYIENIKDLIYACENNDDIFLIIRFRPFEDLSLEQMKLLLPDTGNYIIAPDGPFSDYLEIADLLVSFSSTTIEEALISHIPVLQYDRTDRYMHIKGEVIKDGAFQKADSVYYVGNKDQLSKGIKWITANHLKKDLTGSLFDRHIWKESDVVDLSDFIHQFINKKKI